MNYTTDNKKEEIQDNSPHFFKTDGGKSQSFEIEIPAINLPKGGGAIKGIDEKFSVNAANGSATFSIALPVAPARTIPPALDLSYNSGSGNGIFGLGWSISLPSIKRKTDRQLPQYLDDPDSDTFLFSGAEDLVPEFRKEPDGSFSLDADGHYIIREKNSPDGLFSIRFYLPRIEGVFARIEKWSGKNSREIKWRVISRGNVTTLFGWSGASRLSDPDDADRVFEWLPEFVFDDRGNCVQYFYKKENSDGFDPALPHNRNRWLNGKITYANLYPEKILYGNKTPYSHFGDPYPPESDYLFHTVFDYGEYNPISPYEKIRDWDFRNDAFSEYKAGFEIRTTRLCRRVMLFHHFNPLPGGFALVKSLDLAYNNNTVEGFTFLTGITSRGYIKQADGTYTIKSFPPMGFEYQKHQWNREVKIITQDNLTHAPVGLDESRYHFVDLFNEGLPGILTEQGGGWYYKHNLGGGKFAPAKAISPKPSFTGFGNTLQLLDLDADGGKQLVHLQTEPRGFFELSDDDEWRRFRTFKNIPNIDLQDSSSRLLDLNGDGKPDLLIAGENAFTWYESGGKEGFWPARRTVKPCDEEKGPHIVFSDSTQSIFLADMSGDGLTDLVRVQNGEVCYWPNLGYGKFGARVVMDHAPLFDHSGSFNPSWLRLADIDGSGTTDIIYLGKNSFRCWLNLNGNAFSITPFVMEEFPGIHNLANVTAADLLGDGLTCIVWSGGLSGEAPEPLRYVELMNGKKPHIMTAFRNNTGKEVYLEYTPSTQFYIGDKLADRPWVTRLHFPVHCLSRIETRDVVSGARFVSSYTYHHGYYDHAEREFRGFGLVEKLDSEYYEHWVKGNWANIVDQELHQPPILTKSWFHTGAFLSQEKILSQFAHEYWYEEMKRQGFPVTANEASLPEMRLIAAARMDPAILTHLDAQEWREALRACKSMALRTEIFTRDAPLNGANPTQIQKALTPFSVAEHNCLIELIQPKGQNKHAVFIVKESEAITYNYERNTEDPRVAHNLNVQLDEYGNVLESVSVAYPRLSPDLSLPAATRQEQARTIVIHTQNVFTNDVEGENEHRLRALSESKTHELKGVPKSGGLFTVTDFNSILSVAVEALYHETDREPAPGVSQKRLIERLRTVYYKQDLSGPALPHVLESGGFPFETRQLAYTPELIADIFGAKADAAAMTAGRFIHDGADNNWWKPSGSVQYIEGAETIANARSRFFSPISFTSSSGAKTRVRFDPAYFLFIEETEDPLGNKTRVDLFNFRTLTPQRIKDPNNNLSEIISDELGMVKAMAVYGKGNEADELTGLTEFTTPAELTMIDDFFNSPHSAALVSRGKNLLQRASIRYVYDHSAFFNSGKPVVAATIVREEHFNKLNDAPVQLSFEYSDGLGRLIMKKVQAEPGIANLVTVNPDNTFAVIRIDTSVLSPKQLRWVGNGRAVVNNKGNPVKQYEPYFSINHNYESQKELVETGVTPIWRYDALGRTLKTEMPDGTFNKSEFSSWKQILYDANDVVLDSSWHHLRVNRLIDAELIAQDKDPGREKLAADSAAKHAETPSVVHLDTLGRPILTIEHNRHPSAAVDEFYLTLMKLDVESNLRSVSDPRGNNVMQFKYDMLGQSVFQHGMDSGQRWLLTDIQGNPLRTWDERDHEVRHFYDLLRRPTHSIVLGGDGLAPLNHTYERFFYGESEPNPELKNLRGQTVRHYDTGGLMETPAYDFSGNPLSTTRKLFKNYKSIPNWTDANLVTDLESESFTFTSEYDALERLIHQTTPDASVISWFYNEGGMLNRQTVAHSDPAVTIEYIRDIDYNEKGRRTKIVHGNDVVTRFFYDRETFRLNRLESRRQNGDPLQDWRYTYDPYGNITHIEDKAIPAVFFDNQKITGLSTYIYDALYRLVESTGRENSVALSFNGKDNWNDLPFMQALNPADPMIMRNYVQYYQYDSVGNIGQIRHQAAGNNWTRDYAYEAANNRLIHTKIGALQFDYAHHPRHGFITEMPHLDEMGWNFRDELAKTVRQRRLDGGTPETTYYQYDGQGQRIRKITENQADPGILPVKKEERISIAGYELFKKHIGGDAGLRRVSLSLLDEGERFVVIETRNQVNDGSEKHLTRYQLHNHLGSTGLELDDQARVISYEEYHPFGSTAYMAKNTAVKSAAKRFRFTGMERDEESGLEYHGARYYAPWLGRWLNPDPIGIGDGVNVYAYVSGNPVDARDEDGRQKKPVQKKNNNKKDSSKNSKKNVKKDVKKTPKKEVKKDPKKELEAKIKDEDAKRQKQTDEDEAVLLKIRDDDEIQGAIGDAAELTGIDEEALEQLIIIESRGNKKAKTGSYHGLMQMGEDAFNEVVKNEKTLFDSLKITDKKTKKDRAVTFDDVKNDPWANVMVGALYSKMNRDKLLERDKAVQAQIGKSLGEYMEGKIKLDQFLKDEYSKGRPISDTALNLYLAHQQGFGGIKTLYNNPDASIKKNQKDNLPGFDKSRFEREGPGNKITNQEFIQLWNERFTRLDAIFKKHPAVK